MLLIIPCLIQCRVQSLQKKTIDLKEKLEREFYLLPISSLLTIVGVTNTIGCQYLTLQKKLETLALSDVG